jgi:hypothetical protein
MLITQQQQWETFVAGVRASLERSVTDHGFPLIEMYLAAVAAQVADAVLDQDRIVREIADHLRTSTEQGIADGLSPRDAQRGAIQRFVPVHQIAAAFNDTSTMSRVFDARDGVSADALEDLRHATQVALGPRSAREAVLGYWVPEGTGGDHRERFGAILLRSRSHLPPGLDPVVLADLERNDWRRTAVLSQLRPGMQLNPEPWDGALRLWHGPFQDAAETGQQMYVAFPVSRRRQRVPESPEPRVGSVTLRTPALDKAHVRVFATWRASGARKATGQARPDSPRTAGRCSTIWWTRGRRNGAHQSTRAPGGYLGARVGSGI